MAPPSSSSAATTSVQVALRIRPPTSQDSSSIPARFQRSVIHATSSNTVSIEVSPTTASGSGGPNSPAASSSSAAAKKQQFSFDQVHPPPTTQFDLFTSTAKPLVSRFIEGFNCTILAYGQTSSGKTFTMTGIDLDADPADPNNGMGIIPRAVSSIFSGAKQLKDERGGAWNYNVKGSFIEIYNEDLIDLLSLDETIGGRREVQIREDKDGHIIWGGLREVNVRNAAEVMSLLRKGTSIRRTNETDMNAQSSRSHAIFSLTLTQKKYTGSTPPRSSSPLPPGGRSPSRLARPGSMYASPSSAGTRVASPTFGRPSTPSFAVAMGRNSLRPDSLRPASALGHASERTSHAGGEDEQGEWVTIVSKFHFVDLAGSERLKRTAAAGERIKEGISINSGLLALGNVISALGDPSRSKLHTHVPYRDSKLTRLLQDSLGGNAHTLMIACVSPAEYNANETINTLKYANRARNIKNRAVLNEKEDGWDDVEWLQGTVTRLRKELKVIKNGGVVLVNDIPQEVEGASKKVLAQMTELQNNYESLRGKFVDRTEELTRLRRELGEKQRGSTAGAIGGTARYEEIVGPVIEEYEKTIGAMEAELSLNRAALRHTNELVEEKEEELAAITERHAATELYVEELRSRVAKLSERESSTEAYVRDLEEKIKSYDETSISSSESMTDLKREVLRFKDAESSSTKYIVELEARLGRSDESVLNLQQTVEKLENECERRQNEVKSLKFRLEALRQDGENWRTDLEERERKVKELEQKMVEWEAKKNDANDARARLGSVVGEVASARRSLEINISSAPRTPGETPSASPLSETTAERLSVAMNGDLASSTPHDPALQSQLLALQQTHTATLADLSSVTAKYRDALREISDLAAQIQEAKLSNSEPARSESPDKPVEIPPFRRRMTGGRARDGSDPQINTSPMNASGRRLLFRQAASTESLHARSLSQSQSLSQELSSVHSRKTSFSSYGTSSSHSPSNSHSQSTLSYLTGVRPNLSISLPSTSLINGNERSISSLEKEIMRLQEVLKEREAEIGLLEESLKQSRDEKAPASTTPIVKEESNGKANGAAATLSPKTLNQFDHIRKSMENGNDHAYVDAGSEMNGGSSAFSETDESLERLNELMLSMAQKESHHREVVDDLNSQLSQVQRQLDDLTMLSRDQALNMSNEIEGLRGKHEEDLAKLEEVQERERALTAALKDAETAHAIAIEELRSQHQAALDAKAVEVDDLVTRLKEGHEAFLVGLRDEHQSVLDIKAAEADEVVTRLKEEHDVSFVSLRGEHQSIVDAKAAEVNGLIASLKEEHDSTLAGLRDELAIAAETLEKSHRDHEQAFGTLKAEHEESLRRRLQEADDILATTREEHERGVSKVKAEHEELAKKKDAESNVVLQRTEEEYYNALTKLRGDHAEALKRHVSEMEAALGRLREEHAGDLRMAEIAREGTLSESESSQKRALQELQDAHASAISRKEASFAEELEVLKADQARALTVKAEDFTLQMDRVRLEYETSLAKLKEERRVEVDRLTSDLAEAKDQTTAFAVKAQKDLDEAVRTVKEQNASVLQELERGHEGDLAALKKTHATALQEALKKSEEERSALLHSYTEEAAKRTTQHQQEVTDINATIVALQEEHRQNNESVQEQHERLLAEEKDRFSQTLAALEDDHRQSLEALHSKNQLLVEQQDRLSQSLTTLQDEHRGILETSRSQALLLAEEKEQLSKSLVKLQDEHSESLQAAQSQAKVRAHLEASLTDLTKQHAQELEVLRAKHDVVLQQLDSHKAAADELSLVREQARGQHEREMGQKTNALQDIQGQLTNVTSERDDFEAEVAQLRAELDRTRNEQSKLIQEASKRESLAGELERHRSVLAEMQENLQKVKDEKDAMQVEKTRAETLVRDLQAQVARSASPPNARLVPDRNLSYTRATGLPAMKLPPPTPPPSVPPPPAPRTPGTVNGDAAFSTSSHGSSVVTSVSSRESQPESPSTSVPPTSPPPVDSKVLVKLEQQAKQLDEQEAMIKTLNKQLTHCESDLQTHMDLVSTLETSLGDSEKNLRKARMQATELARERDTLNSKIEALRNELAEAKREVVTVRRSIVEEKQSLEQRLDEERKAKERARHQLDSRMDELQKRKSKFACL